MEGVKGLQGRTGEVCGSAEAGWAGDEWSGASYGGYGRAW